MTFSNQLLDSKSIDFFFLNPPKSVFISLPLLLPRIYFPNVCWVLDGLNLGFSLLPRQKEDR